MDDKVQTSTNLMQTCMRDMHNLHGLEGIRMEDSELRYMGHQIEKLVLTIRLNKISKVQRHYFHTQYHHLKDT